ncbi:nitroreductase-like oxidoreductase [Sphaerochaeta pleomorpha str. Grapes]|uniref:Nitroreductase-like oxidoreductase n=1 Tax=Sphaerochaeta pleomorpha (strain ATCC BAA-1885 / DSM 22778 / Grapes) TaxID=158190 RepID=G8QVH4_SPHPG|nr:nitroreductase family protein [Sphaerochaeta pleomorpha]AEV28207.1 nitroreductase-like oxidoreductase [Sphaerochaeta pleomorpha str. Grapes]
MSNSTIESFKKRRSIYHLGKNLPVSKEVVTNTIKEAVKFAPSAFNSQSARVIILYGDESKKLWAIVMQVLKAMVPSDKFSETEQKINSFDAGAGTALFFEDMSVIKGLQDQMPSYAANFALWSHHGTGITQYAVWTALANIGIGASLQHYGNLIEEQVKTTWNLPSSWSLIAQMPFGSIETPAGEKEFSPIEERVKVIG